MTKEKRRDYFAAHAMQALIMTYPNVHDNIDYTEDSLMTNIQESGWGFKTSIVNEDGEKLSHADMLSMDAYVIADAMIREMQRR